jgi:hypothetical protein
MTAVGVFKILFISASVAMNSALAVWLSAIILFFLALIALI